MSSFITIVRDAVYSITSCCFSNPTMQINKRQFKVIQLLGEGGSSFVYLVQDAASGKLFALKKILCCNGPKAVTDAMREMDMYRKFQHEHIIQILDRSLETDRDGTKVMYIFFPYYKRGNLQDSINANQLNKTRFPERDLLIFFRKVCYALRVLHAHRLPDIKVTNREAEQFVTSPITLVSGSCAMSPSPSMQSLPASFSSPSTPTLASLNEDTDMPAGSLVPYAHRDIKPENILMTDDGMSPILTDFGSVIRARIHIKTHQDALLQQDIAAEKATMSYRAPELYEMHSGTELDEKADIWSLGCTLYTTAYGQNPFDAIVAEQGGSLSLAILNGQYHFPENDPYSDQVRNLIRSMLTVQPRDRPDIHKVISTLDTLLLTV